MSLKDFLTSKLFVRTSIVVSTFTGAVIFLDNITRDNKEAEAKGQAEVKPAVAPTLQEPQVKYSVPYEGIRPVVVLNRNQTDAERQETMQLLQIIAKASNYEYIVGKGFGAHATPTSFTNENANRLTELGVNNIDELFTFSRNFVNRFHVAPVRAFAVAEFKTTEQSKQR